MDEACKHGYQEISYQPRTLAPYLATLFRFYTVNLSQVDEKHGGGGAIITPTKPGEGGLLGLVAQEPIAWGADLTQQEKYRFVARSATGLRKYRNNTS